MKDEMKYFDILKSDGSRVSCVREMPDPLKGIVIAIHGFTSSKESSTYRRLLKRLPAAGFGVICIDLPGHGTGESSKEILSIHGALDSIGAAEQEALREHPGCRIYYFGSSFGAYLIGLYISTREHAGRKAFWRSAAVNMPELFHKEHPTAKEEQWLKDLELKGYFDAEMDGDRPVRVTKAFYDELLQNDLFERFDKERFGEHQIAMAHGKKDAVICPEAAEKFAEKFRIPITWFPNDGHSLSSDSTTPDQVIDLAISHFRQESL